MNTKKNKQLNKKRNIIIFVSSIIMSSSFLVGCSKFSFFDVVFGTGEDVILGTLTETEWGIKQKKEIGVLVTTGETILNGSRYVLKGETPYNEELVDVENAIEQANLVYSNIELMAEPMDKTIEKQQALLAITNYKKSLISYSSALEQKDAEKISKAINDISASINDLVSYSGNLN